MTGHTGTGDTTTPSARERILRAAMDVIGERGEAALRVTDIAETAGVALGLIHHHFGSRDGLVSEAQARRFAGTVREDLDRIEALVGRPGSGEELAAALAALTSDVVDRGRAERRLVRSATVGAALGRPDLREVLAAETTEMLDRMTVIIERARDAGIVRRGIDARAFATFVFAYAFGMVIADLDERPSDPTTLADVIGTAIGVFIAA
jgi:AcrR family transcriptional regulator